MSVDPLAEKYPGWSPYNYTLNNPVKYFDPDGRSPENIHLRFQSPSAKQAYISNVNRFLEITSQISVDDSGNVSLSKTGVQGPLTREQQAFYAEYKAVVDSPFTAKQTIVQNDKNTEVGGFFFGRVDITDIEAFDQGGPGAASSAGVLIHETVEQLEKAKLGLLPNEWSNIVGLDKPSPENVSSHKIAIDAENRVNGNIRNEEEGYFLERDGSKTGQNITPTNDGGIIVEKTKIKL